MRPCNKCGEEKPLDQFSKHKSSRDGYRLYCKSCQKQQTEAWRQRNLPRWKSNMRAASIFRQYGLTREGHAALVAEQAGTCAICKTACSTGRDLAVDHDHTTGKVRGLLCQACNVTLGQMRDDPQLLRAAADYLDERR